MNSEITSGACKVIPVIYEELLVVMFSVLGNAFLLSKNVAIQQFYQIVYIVLELVL